MWRGPFSTWLTPVSATYSDALVRREREPVGSHHVGHLGRDRAVGVDPVDVARPDLALGRVPLGVAVDPVGRVGEPDRTVGCDDDVVRAVEPHAVEPVGEHGPCAVVLEAHDGTGAVLAGDHSALAVQGVSVAEVRRLVGDRHPTGRDVESHPAVAPDVAPEQRVGRRQVDGALGPGATVGQVMEQRLGVEQALEPRVQQVVDRRGRRTRGHATVSQFVRCGRTFPPPSVRRPDCPHADRPAPDRRHARHGGRARPRDLDRRRRADRDRRTPPDRPATNRTTTC